MSDVLDYLDGCPYCGEAEEIELRWNGIWFCWVCLEAFNDE